MKKIILMFGIALVVLLSSSAEAYVSVKGYYRKDGTYVAPHVRSNPNGLKSDNYGYTGGNIYNPSYGTRGTTWDTSTKVTDPNYYVGKNYYETKTVPTYTPTYIPTYTPTTYKPITTSTTSSTSSSDKSLKETVNSKSKNEWFTLLYNEYKANRLTYTQLIELYAAILKNHD